MGDQVHSVNDEEVSSLDTLINSIKSNFEETGSVVIGLSTMHGVIKTKEGVLGKRFVVKLDCTDNIGWGIGQDISKVFTDVYMCIYRCLIVLHEHRWHLQMDLYQ